MPRIARAVRIPSWTERGQADIGRRRSGESLEDWAKELEIPVEEGTLEMLRKRTHSGYPCGDEAFIERLSQILGRPLVRRPRGRPRKH